MTNITFERYLKWAKFYRDELDLYIAPVESPIVNEDGSVTPTKNGKEKYYKVMPVGYKGRYHGKDDYLRYVPDAEIEEWYNCGFGLAVITKGWSEKYKKYQRIFDIDSFGTLTKKEFWDKYSLALGNTFVTESFKGYHIFVFSDVEISITNFTLETPEKDILTGEVRYGTKSGHTVEPPSLSVDDSKWVLNGRYTIANFCEEPGDLPLGWNVTNHSAKKSEIKSIKTNDTIDAMRDMIEGKSKKGEGQGVYNLNLNFIGKTISKIKDKDDVDKVEEALKKVIAFNAKHTEGYSEKEVRDTFFDILKKDTQKTKMDKVEVDMMTVSKAGGNIVQDISDGAVYIQIDGKHNHLLSGKTAQRWIINAIEPKDKAQVSNLTMRLDANVEKQVRLGYRIARNEDNAICYSLGDDDGTIVTVTPSGWECAPSPDVCLFKPCSGNKKQVVPLRGGDINDIFEFVNIKEELKPLFLCVLVFYFVPNMQYPILSLFGAKGSGKSTVASMLRSIIDPNEASFDTIDPKKIEDARVALSSSHLSVIDNISHVSQEMSDLFCVLSTGGAHRKRTLYTDGDVHLSQAIKPIILTSITQEIKREDLLSRTVLLEIEPLTEKLTASELQNNFNAKLPSILGGVFDVLSQIKIGEVDKSNLVRMSDFHLYSRAIGKVLGFEIDDLLRENFHIQEEEAIENSDVGRAVRDYMSDKQTVELSATEWVSVLGAEDPTFKKIKPNWFTRGVKQLKGSFKEIGIIVETDREGKKRGVKIYHEEENTEATPQDIF